ncbi:hypothetical protein [Solemya pervernicosa gill symbiont]|nr:hypothetical protein [Solemya pervernicosa gill symbiont]
MQSLSDPLQQQAQLLHRASPALTAMDSEAKAVSPVGAPQA